MHPAVAHPHTLYCVQSNSCKVPTVSTAASLRPTSDLTHLSWMMAHYLQRTIFFFLKHKEFVIQLPAYKQRLINRPEVDIQGPVQIHGTRTS